MKTNRKKNMKITDTHGQEIRRNTMSTTLTQQEPQAAGPASEELKLGRRHSRQAGLFDRELLKTALRQSFIMLRPDIQWKTR